MHRYEVGTADQNPWYHSDERSQFACHSELQASARKIGEQSGNAGVQNVFRFHPPIMRMTPVMSTLLCNPLSKGVEWPVSMWFHEGC